MGITERKKREKEQRRNDIIDAAEKVFFSKGKANSTMDDVAEEAELSKGTLYLYFKSKEDLYLAINLRGLNILEGLFTKAVMKAETGLEKVRAIGRAYFQYSSEYPDYFNALMYFDSNEMNMAHNSQVDTDWIQKEMDPLDNLIDAIREGHEDGSISKKYDPTKTAIILWGQSSGIIQLALIKGDHLQESHGINKDELINYYFEIIKNFLTD